MILLAFMTVWATLFAIFLINEFTDDFCMDLIRMCVKWEIDVDFFSPFVYWLSGNPK